MSIRNCKRFYTAEDATSFVVFESTSTFATTDQETISLTYESTKSSKSDLTGKKKAKRMSFLYDSGLPVFRSKFVYAALKNSSMQWKYGDWSPRFIVRLWQGRYRQCHCKLCK